MNNGISLKKLLECDMSKIRIIISAFIIIGIQFAYAQDTKKSLDIQSGNVVKVGKNIITASELDKTFAEMNNLAAVYGKNITKKEVLGMMIDDYLVKDKIKQEPLVLDQNMYNQELNSMKQQFAMMKQGQNENYQYTDADFSKYIEVEGKMTYQAFQEKIEQKVLVRQYLYKLAGPKLQDIYKKTYEASKDFPVSLPSATGAMENYNSLRDIYDQNEESFIIPSQVVLKHIYFRTIDGNGEMKADDKAAVKERASDAYKRLSKGEPFDKLCLIYSDDPTSKEETEDPDTKTTHRGYIGPAYLSGRYSKLTKDKFGESVFTVLSSLEKGKYTQVIESPYGYHIFFAINKKNKTFMPFEEAKPTIVNQLKSMEEQMAVQKVYADLIADLKKKSEIKYFMKEYE